MLDTYGRKYLDPAINKAATMINQAGFTANQVTMAAFVLGIGAALLALTKHPVLSVSTLWLSGFMDAVDGAVARKTGTSSSWGTLMDIVSDRVVELLIILTLAITRPGSQLALLFLVCSIVLSMTVFLTVGALSKVKGKKSFYYQAGLAERTEGFLFFSAMILFPAMTTHITCIFAACVAFTGCQRLLEAKKILH